MHFSVLLPIFLALSASATPVIEARAPACNNDNLLRCVRVSSIAASAYCTSILGGTTSTIATVTPTVTSVSTVPSVVTVTGPLVYSASPTNYLTISSIIEQATTVTTTASTVTSFSFSTATVTAFADGGVTTTKTTVYQQLKREIEPSSLAVRDALQARAAATPVCLTKNGNALTSYPASRVTSACGCIGVTRSTVYVTAAAPASTVATAVTTPTTTTLIATSYIPTVVRTLITITTSSTSIVSAVVTVSGDGGISTVTSTATTFSTATTTISAFGNPTCTNLLSGENQSRQQIIYDKYYEGVGYREDMRTSPGYDAGHPLNGQFYPYPDYSFCNALEACAEYVAGGSAQGHLSFAFYRYPNQYICEPYYNANRNPGKYFTIVDPNVLKGFAYSA